MVDTDENLRDSIFEKKVSLLIEEYKTSRSEIAQATAYTTAAVRTILGSLVASTVGFAAQRITVIEQSVVLRDAVVVSIGMFLLMSALYYFWVLSNYAFILSRTHYEMHEIRTVIVDLLKDSRLINWDKHDDRLKRLWVRSRAAIAAIAYLIIVAFHLSYMFIFGYHYESSFLSKTFILLLAWSNILADVGIILFLLQLHRTAMLAFDETSREETSR
jgi:hypothetical protein